MVAVSENPTNRTKKPRSAGSEAGLSRGFAEMRVTANPPRQYHINGCTAAAFRSWTRRAVRGIGWEFVHPCIDDVLFVVGFSRCACARPPAIGQAVALHGIDASSGAAPAARPYGSGGCIALERVVGGLHHDYCQILFFDTDSVCLPDCNKEVRRRGLLPQPLHFCNLRSATTLGNQFATGDHSIIARPTLDFSSSSARVINGSIPFSISAFWLSISMSTGTPLPS